MKIAIFGSSGFAREVADIACELKYKNIIFLEKENYSNNYVGSNYKIISENEVPLLKEEGFHFVIGVGDPKVRELIFSKNKELQYPNIIHPSATFGHKMLDTIKLTKGNIITAGVRMTNNIQLGSFGIYNLNVTIGHDCLIDDFITISPGANISGNVEIKKSSYIGTGATILQGKSFFEKIVVGTGAIVGAGAVVTKNVDPNTIVKGIPAKK